jgi:predicted RNase H-like HicB family nuclease
MKRIILFRISAGANCYVAECLDLPIVCQAKSLDELKSNLEEAITFLLDDENLSKYDIDPHPSVLASFELDPLTYSKT